MHIQKLALQDFRNIEHLQLKDLSTGTHIFVGKNAMGKTNLLEAINYLSCGRSFRGATDAQLIRYDAPFAGIAASYALQAQTGQVQAYLLGNGKRSITINKTPIKRVSELMGVVNTVVFAPEDLRTIKESPGLRRRMLDLEISKISPAYYVDLQNFYATLKQKNKILKNRVVDETLLCAYNESIINYSSGIIQKRDTFIHMLNQYVKPIYAHLSDSVERIDIAYKSTVVIKDDIALQLEKKLAALSVREKELSMSLVGPHREDITIRINEKDAKQNASQGQQRTAMLAIKLACAQIAEHYTKEQPILLLDDVFSELDVHRRSKLLEFSVGQQIFITTTDLTGFPAALKSQAKVFEVSHGKVKHIT